MFAVLRCVASALEGITLSALIENVGLPRPTVIRLLAALKAERFVRIDPQTGRYVLGAGALELTGCYISSQSVRQAALPFLWELAQQTRETLNLCIQDETEVICIEQVESLQTVRAVNWMARRFPLHATSAGKALIAFLPEPARNAVLKRLIDSSGCFQAYTPFTLTSWDTLRENFEQARQCGYATAHEEYEMGLAAVAAPVFDSGSKLIASICITGPAFRFTEERTAEMGQQAAHAARHLSAALGYPATDFQNGKERTQP